MSSTAIEINVPVLRRSGAISEAMPHPYVPPTTWAADPHHTHTRPTAAHHTQAQLNYDRPPPRPAGPDTGGLNSRRSSQFHTQQHQLSSGAFQQAEMPPSSLHLSHGPPPLGLPSHQPHQPHLPVANLQRHYVHDVPRFPAFSSSVDDGRGAFESHQMALSRKPSVAGIQPSPFAFAQRPRTTDTRSVPRLTGHQFEPADTAGAMLPDNPGISPIESKHDPIKISDLISPSVNGGNRSNSTGGLPPSTDGQVQYRLRIRQQPVAARSCGFGERDRRVVDPPPIVQLIIEGPNISQDDIGRQLRYCHYVMSCSIYDETGTRDASFMPEEYRQQRRLMGSLVGAPFVGKDEFGQEGCFFCFPDLSCRTPGSFRLKFNLVKIDPARAREIKHFPVLVETKSEVFTVYTAKDFPGMQASTKLTKGLKEQGCIISIKKGNDRAKNARVHGDSSDGEQDEGELTSQGKRRRRMGRQ